MLYHYVAADKSGKLVEADIDAETLAQVLQNLAGKELRPISVKPLKEKIPGWRFLGSITTDDKLFLTKYLALMLRVGTDLLSAVNILVSDFDKPAVRNFLLEVRDNLSKGQPFYRAFEAHERIFSKVFVGLIKAAEASGNLEQTFEDLSVSLVREADLKNRVRSAMIYPAVLLFMSSAIIAFLVSFALPKIAGVFEDAGIEPPIFSRAVFVVGLFVGRNIWVIVAIFLGLLAVGIYGYFRTNLGRYAVNQALTKTPFVKKIYRDLAIQRMASTISSLMKAGLPIIQTLNIAAATVGLPSYRFSLERIANEGLAKGLTIGEAFKREVIFPKTVTNLIAISEKAGHLEEVLTTLADFYANSVENGVKALVSLLEPILLLTMGLLVAVIALAIIVPIYQLTAQF